MSAKNEDLHGNVPDKAAVALLLIDVINDLEFDKGVQLLKHALPMAAKLATLKGRAKQAGIPAIYVNDNFGKWQHEALHGTGFRCLEAGVRSTTRILDAIPAVCPQRLSQKSLCVLIRYAPCSILARRVSGLSLSRTGRASFSRFLLCFPSGSPLLGDYAAELLIVRRLSPHTCPLAPSGDAFLRWENVGALACFLRIRHQYCCCSGSSIGRVLLLQMCH